MGCELSMVILNAITQSNSKHGFGNSESKQNQDAKHQQICAIVQKVTEMPNFRDFKSGNFSKNFSEISQKFLRKFSEIFEKVFRNC